MALKKIYIFFNASGTLPDHETLSRWAGKAELKEWTLDALEDGNKDALNEAELILRGMSFIYDADLSDKTVALAIVADEVPDFMALALSHLNPLVVSDIDGKTIAYCKQVLNGDTKYIDGFAAIMKRQKEFCGDLDQAMEQLERELQQNRMPLAQEFERISGYKGNLSVSCS